MSSWPENNIEIMALHGGLIGSALQQVVAGSITQAEPHAPDRI